MPRLYVHADNSEDFSTRARAALRWLPINVLLTGLAACAVYGLIDTPPELIRATAPSPLHVRSPSWLRLRRCVAATEPSRFAGVRIAPVAHAIVHAWEESHEGARAAIFTALREGKTTVASLRQALDHYPRVKKRRTLEAFLSHLLDGMHSFLEYEGARKVLNTPDLAGMTYQEPFLIEGHRFYADRYDPTTRTSVEFDGREFHGSPEGQARDAWRDSLFRSIDVLPIHIPYADVMARPAWCRDQVRRAIASRRSSPDAAAARPPQEPP